jgi:thiamine phosphate synthase YjbQ (UPF0047 family)
MIFEHSLSTPREDFHNVTAQLREAVAKSSVTDGIAVVFCPHTTAGIQEWNHDCDETQGERL